MKMVRQTLFQGEHHDRWRGHAIGVLSGTSSTYSLGRWILTAKKLMGVGGWKVTKRKHQGSGLWLNRPHRIPAEDETGYLNMTWGCQGLMNLVR